MNLKLTLSKSYGHNIYKIKYTNIWTSFYDILGK